MTKYLHLNCHGQIKTCPNNDEGYCDKCGKWVDESDILEAKPVKICSNIEQGSSRMKHSTYIEPIVGNNDFEVTNCPDPDCFICVKKLQGYPSKLNLHPYHKRKAADALVILLERLGRVA